MTDPEARTVASEDLLDLRRAQPEVVRVIRVAAVTVLHIACALPTHGVGRLRRQVEACVRVDALHFAQWVAHEIVIGHVHERCRRAAITRFERTIDLRSRVFISPASGALQAAS